MLRADLQMSLCHFSSCVAKVMALMSGEQQAGSSMPAMACCSSCNGHKQAYLSDPDQDIL